MTSSYSGVLSTEIAILIHDPDIPESQPFDLEMITVPDRSKELLSVDSYYDKQGYEINRTHPDRGGTPSYDQE